MKKNNKNKKANITFKVFSKKEKEIYTQSINNYNIT